MYKSKQMIVIRRDLKMRKGKIAAQAGHACVDAVLRALLREGRLADIREENGHISLAPSDKPETPLSQWFAAGTAKICVYVDSEAELLSLQQKAEGQGFISSLVRDAGMTEFHGEPTFTCLALEPLCPEQADPLTGGLPLY